MRPESSSCLHRKNVRYDLMKITNAPHALVFLILMILKVIECILHCPKVECPTRKQPSSLFKVIIQGPTAKEIVDEIALEEIEVFY